MYILVKGENFWNFSELVSKIVGFAGKIFPTVSYAQTQIPSYPTGCIGFILCSLEDKKSFSQPMHKFDETTVAKFELKYYSSEMHAASFVLPTSFEKVGRNFTILFYILKEYKLYPNHFFFLILDFERKLGELLQIINFLISLSLIRVKQLLFISPSCLRIHFQIQI